MQKLLINSKKVLRVDAPDASPSGHQFLGVKGQPAPGRFDKCLLTKFQAHREALTSMQLLTIAETFLLTSSLDGYIKIWDIHRGEEICSLNINHPLPLKWDIQLAPEEQLADKAMSALRVVDLIFRRYCRQDSFL